MCMAALTLAIGTAVQAQNRQFYQSVYLNGNIPTGQFASDAAPNQLALYGVPLGYKEIGKDAAAGFGLGYRASFRFDVGVGQVAPFFNADFLWNTIGGGWSDKYSDAKQSKPTYFNIPAMLGVSYLNDRLPWNAITGYLEFGLGTDLLWITSEGDHSNYPKLSYKPDFAFAWMSGLGAYFGHDQLFSAGIYYYGLGKHEIAYTSGTIERLRTSEELLPTERRTVGSVMLRLGFHF